MFAVWHGDVSQLTNQLQQSLNLSNGRQFNVNEIIPSRFQNTHLLWTNCLIGTFAEPVERNCWDVKNALLFQWGIHGGLSVRKASEWIYIIRFQHEHEMRRVLNLATRRVFGDLFCIKQWEAEDDLEEWYPTVEMFFITISNLTPAQVTSDNLRRYLACMGEILSFSYPVRKNNGSFSITVRASIRFRQRLMFTIRAENELGFVNPVYFEFHNFPCNFCEYCGLIGHKMRNCFQADLAQHQAEINQARADAVLLEMQQQVVLEQEQMQPMMVQDNMELTEDSLYSSSVEQAATEVTCQDYISQLDDDKENQIESMHNHLSNDVNVNIGTSSGNEFRDSYMWKVIQKRDRPGNPFRFETGFWNEASSSQPQQQISNENSDYFRNWNLMQSYFHWDNPLPIPKRPRVDNLELTVAPPVPRQVEIRVSEVTENELTLRNAPHQWFQGGSSSGINKTNSTDD